jgi:hypothetical protein
VENLESEITTQLSLPVGLPRISTKILCSDTEPILAHKAREHDVTGRGDGETAEWNVLAARCLPDGRVRRALRRTGPNPTRATCRNLTLRLASRPWIQISRLSLHSLDRSRKLRNEQQFRIRAFRESKWLECWR